MRRAELFVLSQRARSPKRLRRDPRKSMMSSVVGMVVEEGLEVVSLKLKINRPVMRYIASLRLCSISFALLLATAVPNTALAETGVEIQDNYRKGAEQKRLMSNKEGVSAADPVLSEVAKIAPDLERFAMEFVFGQVLSRPGLEVKQREIATLAALTALGGAEAELRLHVGTALDVGLSKEQIVEVLLQQVVYAGFPRAINALLVAKSVFEARGL